MGNLLSCKYYTLSNVAIKRDYNLGLNAKDLVIFMKIKQNN